MYCIIAIEYLLHIVIEDLNNILTFTGLKFLFTVVHSLSKPVIIQIYLCYKIIGDLSLLLFESIEEGTFGYIVQPQEFSILLVVRM